ncbi:peptidoglycan-binding protein [Arenimonas sp.]|nr:peptidoglycan-binding protein [Candidatus Parcubacteria bacterium]
MTKALSIILLICILGGGIYFSKNYMKKGVSEGTPISEVVKSGKAKYGFESSFGPVSTDSKYIPVDYKIKLLEANNLDTNPIVKITCPNGVSGVYSQKGNGLVDKCNTSVPFVLFTKSSSNSQEYYLTLSFTNRATTTKVVTAQAMLGAKTIGTTTNSIASTLDKSVSTTTSMLKRNLTIGSSGDDVVILKSFLVTKGFLLTSSNNASSNFFGIETLDAVKKFQVSVSIVPADGYVGPQTRTIINATVK